MKKLLLVLNFVYLSFLLGYSQEVSYLGSKSIGSRNFPTLNSFFGTSYSQSIYLSSELPSDLDTIHGIQYQIKSGNINGANQWEVYLGQTTQSSYAFTGPNQYNDFVTNITKVYDGTVSIVGGKITIFFDTPFIRSISSNLVVSVNEVSSPVGSPEYWQTSVGSDPSNNMSLQAYGGTLNPFSPPGGTDRKAFLGSTANGGFFRPYTGFITSEKCEAPTNVILSNVKATTADIEFKGKNGTSWEVNKFASGSLNSNQNLTDSTGTLSGLVKFKDHSIKVRSNCGTGGFSEFSQIATVRTLICDDAPTTLIEEDFSSSNIFNECWTSIGDARYSNTPADGNIATGSIKFVGNAQSYLIFPEIKELKGGKLTYWAKGNVTYTIGTMSNNYDAGTFTQIKTLATNFVYKKDSVDFSSYNGTNKFIAIRASSPFGATTLDDVTFTSKADSTINETLCYGDSYTLNSNIFSESGTFRETISTSQGDSTVQLNLTILPEQHDTIKISVCDSYTGPKGIVWTTSGIYADTLLSTLTGCDSIIVTDLTIATVDLSNIDLSPKEVCDDTDLLIPLPNAQSTETYTLINATTGDTLDGPKQKPNSSFVLARLSNFGLNSGSLSQDITLGIKATSQKTVVQKNGIELNGTDEYIKATLENSFDYSSGFTFEGWIKAPLPNNDRYNSILFFGDQNRSNVEYYIQKGSNTPFLVFNRTSTSVAGSYTFPTPPDNQWYHLAITFDGSVAKVYYNGIEQTALTSTSSTPNDTPNDEINIGYITSSSFKSVWGNKNYSGQMDEVRVWDYARNNSDINLNQSKCLKGNESGLQYYFPFENNTNTSTQDLVSQTNITVQNGNSNTLWVDGVSIDCNEACVAPSTPQKVITVINLDNSITHESNSLKITPDADSYQWIDCTPTVVLAKISAGPISGETDFIYTPSTNGSFKAEITKGSCTKETNCFSFVLNSLNILPEGSVQVLPNPAQDILSINTSYEIQKIEVYNTSGVLIKEFNNQVTLDISSLNSGLYNIRIYTPSGIAFQKVTKE